MTDFDVWWADQDCGNLYVKDICRKQWVTMEGNDLDCSTITQIMDNAWGVSPWLRSNACEGA